MFLAKQSDKMNKIKKLPSGTYPALASGNQSVVIYENQIHYFKFERFVKGINVPDVITVDNNGQVNSKVLGDK